MPFLRRSVRPKTAKTPEPPAVPDQLLLPTFADELLPPAPEARTWDFCVLVTNMPGHDAAVLAQLYRDRGDCENLFDELKNQWGWCGFTTRDLARNRIVARLVALVYNLWSLYVNLAADGGIHREAKTSRPLLLNLLGRLVRTGRRTTLHLCSTHALADAAIDAISRIHRTLERLKAAAEQLGRDAIWTLLLAWSLRHYYGPDPPPGLPGQQTFGFA